MHRSALRHPQHRGACLLCVCVCVLSGRWCFCVEQNMNTSAKDVWEGLMLPAKSWGHRHNWGLQRKQMVPHALKIKVCVSSLVIRASCCGGSPRPLAARTERLPATRSATGKDPAGARQLRPPEAPSFSSSLMVICADTAVCSTIIANVMNKSLPAVSRVSDVFHD